MSKAAAATPSATLEKSQTVIREILPMQIDCVGWNQEHSLLAVGGYELVKTDTSLRTGILYLITVDSSMPNGFAILQQEPSSGILDLKWQSVKQDLLATATSNSVLIYQIQINEAGLFNLEKKFAYYLEPKSTIMALFVEWMNETQLIYSDSIGSINILEILDKKPELPVTHDEEESKLIKEMNEHYGKRPIVNEFQELTLVESVNLHNYTIWIVHFDSKSKIIYSGADDGTFTAFIEDNFQSKENHFVKRFPVGVTSISTKDDIVAVGCYDDLLRIYTYSMSPEPEFKVSLTYHAEINLGGAVWRTLWIPPIRPGDSESASEFAEKEYKIGVAAARNGVHLLTLKRTSSTWSWERNLSCLDYPGFLAYGIDVKVNRNKTYTFANCYFDNHALHVWNAKPF